MILNDRSGEVWNRSERQADYSPPSNTVVKYVELYIYSSIRLHGVVII
jgi:hypothetical protein